MNAMIRFDGAQLNASREPRFPAHLTRHTTLRDGTPIVIRPIRASDTRLELAFVRGLSPATRYNRLFSARDLLPGELHRLTHIDYDHEMALIATTPGAHGEEEIGVARYIRDEDRYHEAEFAIVIGDDWQHRGLGEILLRALIVAALENRVAKMSGLTLSENSAMLGLAEKLGFTTGYQLGDATVTRLTRRLEIDG